MPIYANQNPMVKVNNEARDLYVKWKKEYPIEARRCEATIRIIDRLELEFPNTDVFLGTSHMRLFLTNRKSDGPMYVILEYVMGERYDLSYRMPPAKSPYPSWCQVHSSAEGFEEAMEFIKIGMRESEGWPDSKDLTMSGSNRGKRDEA